MWKNKLFNEAYFVEAIFKRPVVLSSVAPVRVVYSS